jgi:glycosyltransferase involved in cell wall biosynthesis
VAAALACLAAAENIGAVGGKIVRTNGLLQEAGSIIWNEGTTVGYMRDASPLAAEANFRRDVDYCSAVFLLCRTDLVRALGGFDEAFAPAYFEDVDLCVRMLNAGYRVVYDPAVVVHHLEFGSATTTEASMALMRRGRRIFRKKHAEFLKTQHPPSEKTLVAARGRGVRPRVLFIEDTVPLRRLGSGFVRSNDIVHAIAAAGFDVHVFPLNGAAYDIMSLFGGLPDEVEVLHDHDFTQLAEFLAARRNVYDLVWIARTHNFARVLPYLRKAGLDPARVPVVLDTEAVATNRAGSGGALRAEFAGVEICREILAVSPAEVAQLRALGLSQTSLLGTARAPSPTPNGFAARDGLLFVAGIHQQDSPNLDSLAWYLREILPALAAALGEAPVLHVVGYTAPGIDLSVFRHERIKLHGAADDLAPFYNAARVFIAPTRFAAGTPYKIYEAAAHGLPSVGTALLRAQLGWGDEMLSAPVDDAPAFARQIARLYHDDALWRALREAALARLEAENGFAAFNAKVAQVLRAALGE